MGDMMGYKEVPHVPYFQTANVTLAESGNAMLKHWTQLWLMEPVRDDTSMLTQIQEFKSLITQVGTSSGRGLNSLTHDRADRNTQMHATKAYVVEFSNKCG